jgi:putative redox protein
MSDAYRVALRTIGEGPTALVSAGPFTTVTDRPAGAGGGGLGFNGGQLLYASIAGCYSNDLYREAGTLGITLRRVSITVDGDFPKRGERSTPISVDIEVEGDGPAAAIRELIELVDGIAEIPNSIRGTTPVELRTVRVGSTEEGRDRE